MSAPYQESAPPSGAPGGKTSLGLESNVGAMLCYIGNIICCLGIILSIIFVITEKENRFVKFHAVQSLFLFAVYLVLSIVIEILGGILRIASLDFVSFFVTWGLWCVVSLIILAFWLLAGIKAYGGQWYKLPAIGNLAWSIVNKESNT